MAVIEDPDTSTNLAKVEATHKAMRATLRPMELGLRGAYSMGQKTGILPAGLAGNSEIFQWRFVHASFLCLIRSVQVSAAVSSTAFIAGVPPTLAMTIARSWTGQGTGGARITLAANDCKKRTSFASSVLGANDVAIATNAALVAGTKTLDTAALSAIVGNTGGATVTTQIIPPGTYLWQRNTSDEYPLLFANQEGFVITVPQVPGTGTWTVAVNVEWAELDPAAVLGW